MSNRRRSGYWRTILKGVAIVYGVSCAAGLVLSFDDITPQTNPNVYPLFALVTGAVGVAIALRAARTTRVSYLLGIGLGLWLVGAAGVLAGAETVTGWLASSVSIASTVILGRLLIATGRETPRPFDLSLKGIIHERNSGLMERHARNSHF